MRSVHSIPLANARGFSLIELLAAIAVLGILVAILIPVVNTVRDRSTSVGSMSNLRQIGTIVGLYVNENKGYLPTWRTWGDPQGGGGSWVWDNYGFGKSENGWTGGILPYMAGYHPGGMMDLATFTAPGAEHIFNSPANDPEARPSAWAANVYVMRDLGQARHAASIPIPGDMIMIADNSVDAETPNFRRWFGMSGVAGWEAVFGFHRHNGKAHTLMVDLSVRAMGKDEILEKHIDPAEQQ